MQTLGANRRGNTATYIAMCILVSAASSLFNPVLSLFLNTKLHFSPLQISIFFILLPLATIIIVQTVARFSDMGLQRPAIVAHGGTWLVVMGTFGRPERKLYDWQVKNCGGFRVSVQENPFTLKLLEEL